MSSSHKQNSQRAIPSKNVKLLWRAFPCWLRTFWLLDHPPAVAEILDWWNDVARKNFNILTSEEKCTTLQISKVGCVLLSAGGWGGPLKIQSDLISKVSLTLLSWYELLVTIEAGAINYWPEARQSIALSETEVCWSGCIDGSSPGPFERYHQLCLCHKRNLANITYLGHSMHHTIRHSHQIFSESTLKLQRR